MKKGFLGKDGSVAATVEVSGPLDRVPELAAYAAEGQARLAAKVAFEAPTSLTTSSVKRSTARSSGSKQSASMSSRPSASIWASPTPASLAMGRCWIHSYSARDSLATRRIASSRKPASSFWAARMLLPSRISGRKLPSAWAISLKMLSGAGSFSSSSRTGSGAAAGST